MYFAFWMADRVQSTLVPREQKPCLSGGLTDTNATSRLITFLRNKRGISLRNIGIASARPSITAFRELPPTKREFERNISENV